MYKLCNNQNGALAMKYLHLLLNDSDTTGWCRCWWNYRSFFKGNKNYFI